MAECIDLPSVSSTSVHQASVDDETSTISNNTNTDNENATLKKASLPKPNDLLDQECFALPAYLFSEKTDVGDELEAKSEVEEDCELQSEYLESEKAKEIDNANGINHKENLFLLNDESTCELRDSSSNQEEQFLKYQLQPSTTKEPDNQSSPLQRQQPLASLAEEESAIETGTELGRSQEERNLERFLFRQRSEIMFELRNLRLGERPVSDRERWRIVEQFLTRNGEENTEDEIQATLSSVRPIEISSEIERLADIRPVTTALSSNTFRRRLEEAVRSVVRRIEYSQTQPLPRSYLQTMSANVEIVNRVQQRVQTQQTEVQPALSREPLLTPPEQRLINQLPQLTANQTQTASTEMPRMAPLGQPGRIEGQQNDSENAIDSNQPLPVLYERRANLPVRVEGVETGNHGNREYLPRNVGQNLAEDIRLYNLFERLSDPELVSEINELLHSHVVTSALQSNFRGVLERTFSERLSNVLANQQQQEQIIRRDRLQNMELINNNIRSNERANNSARVTSSIEQQMRSMQSELDEFRRMMRLSLELQLDVQRSIRQEVAAALNSNNNATSTNVPTPAMVSEGQCVVCLEQPVNTVMYDCGHMCACHQCAYTLKADRRSCPICRAPIKDVIVVYKAN